MMISTIQATGSAARSATTAIPPPRVAGRASGRRPPVPPGSVPPGSVPPGSVPLVSGAVSAVDMASLRSRCLLRAGRGCGVLGQHRGRVGGVVIDRRADLVLGQLVA